MWTWLGIAVLARVLMASNEADQYPSINSIPDRDQVGEDVGEVELPGELLTQEKMGRKLSKYERIEQDSNPYENSISNLIRELGSSTSEISPHTPKELEDEREKRSSIKDNDSKPSASWMSWMTLENKAVPFRSGQDPWQEIKKSRAFSPWGGKRVSLFGQGPKVRRPIRVPFNSWGGKRSSSEDEKRTRFSSWGGKRSWYFGGDENSVEKGLEKRTKFNAWGGKRSKNDVREDEEIKRTRFNAWGGKRGDKNYKRTPEEIVAKKRVFNAWGGKRLAKIDEANRGVEKGFKKYVEGERTMEELSGNNNMENKNVVENIDDDIGNEIPSESDIIELPDKKGADNAHKSLFNPWGGKKRSEYNTDLLGPGLNLILPEPNGLQGHNQERFWSYGG